jgi:transposase
VLFHHFNWQTISLIAGLTLWNFYFEIFQDSIRSEHVVVFLDKLQRCVPGKLLLVWDRLSAHRSKLVRDYLGTLKGRIQVEYLPPYAPELNPVEYIWAYLKHHELPNVCAKDLWNLGEGARRSLKRMRRNKRVITAVWKQSSLWP